MLRLTPAAEQDLVEATAWYDGEHEGLGDRFLVEVRSTLQRIDAGPLRYPEVEGRVRRALTQRFPYSVYFEPENVDDWVVLAVLHQRRDPSIWMERSSSR